MFYKYHNYQIIAGTDEVGRGCLAGPVVAAAVILPPDFYFRGLNDSKLLDLKNRERLYRLITKYSISWKVVFLDHEKIDEINILNASHQAMHEAVLSLNPTPDITLVDGNSYKKDAEYPYRCIVDGDSLYAPIAAASILAKVERDRYMSELALQAEYRFYHWNENKGYATPKHIAAIKQYGYSNLHRKSFVLKALQESPDS